MGFCRLKGDWGEGPGRSFAIARVAERQQLQREYP